MGHSQGTTQMFYALSTNEKWIKERVNLFVALAPIASMRDATSLNTLSYFLNEIWKTL